MPKRLGIYIDTVYRYVDGDPVVVAIDPIDFAFVGIFLPEVAAQFASLTLFGRTIHRPVGNYVTLPSSVKLVELPHYGALWRLFSVLWATAGTIRAFWHGLALIDAVWVFGPHPLGILLIGLATLRRKQVILGVRQDTVAYFRARISRWSPWLFGAYALDFSYRLLSRRLKTIVTGPQIARSYSNAAQVLVMIESVIRSKELRTTLWQRDWSGPIEVLTVGRLDQEKNPLLLVEAIAELEREQPGRYRLSWVGGGPMEKAVRQRAAELGVTERIDLLGFMPFGPQLLQLYRRAHMFVHVSLTEGALKVIVEALGCATPIVATDVGSVRHLLAGGLAGLLVPPEDLDALVAGIKSDQR